MPIKNISGSINIGFRASATLSGKQIRTGRAVVADALYGRVQSWAKNPGQSESELVSQFFATLEHQSVLPVTQRRCFRGRRDLDVSIPSPSDFGPAPARLVKENRYNRAREQALYLCDSTAGIVKEFNGVDTIWSQCFLLPSDLRIANFRLEDDDSLVSKIFWTTENAEKEDNGYSYHFGPYVAQLVSTRFDGMAVPGVRGNATERYFNIVMFKRIDEWQQWLSLGEAPVRLR